MASTKVLVIMKALFYVKSFCIGNVKETDAANYICPYNKVLL